MSALETLKSVASGNPIDVAAAIVGASLKNTNDAKATTAFASLVEEILLELSKEWQEEKHKRKQPPSQEDVAQGLIRFHEAYHRARNNKKRRLLYTAFWSSFRPDFYDEGMSEILWQKVQDLEYPDLLFLAKVIDKTDPDERTSVYYEPEGGLGPWKGDQLAIYESSEEAEYANRLADRGLVTVEDSKTHGVILVSWRGVAAKLKQFALEELWKEKVGDPPAP